jgi:hypothetical protein
MKKIFTLITVSFISVFALAAEKKPDVKVTSTGEYLIIVDGKQYKNEKKIILKDMEKGIHYIDVFKKKKGLFGSKYKLVSSKQFEIEKKDLEIDVNASGYIKIGKNDSWDGDQWYKNRDKSKEKNL